LIKKEFSIIFAKNKEKEMFGVKRQICAIQMTPQIAAHAVS
jgi:hypothetical protein